MLSFMLIAAMILSVSSISPTMAASTNPTVASAVTEVVGTTPAANVTALDLSGRDAIIGKLDVNELKADYAGLIYINVGSTNITDIVDAPGVTVDAYDTIKSGERAIVDDDVTALPTQSKAAPTPIDIDAIYNALKLKKSDGSKVPLPAALISDISYYFDTDPATPYVLGSGAINIPATMNAGNHTLNLKLKYSNSAVEKELSFPFAVKDISFEIDPITANVLQGGTVKYTVIKKAEDGTVTSVGAVGDYTITIDPPNPDITTSAEVVSGKLVVTVSTASTTTTGISNLKVTDIASNKEVTAAVNVNAVTPVPGMKIKESNNGNVGPELATDTRIYVRGGTSIASTDITSAESGYTTETVYLLYDNAGNPIGESYAPLVVGTVTPANPNIKVEGIAVGNQAAVKISAVPVANVETGDLTIGLNGMPATDIVLKYSILKSRPEAYCIYQVPPSIATSSTLTTAADFEELIKAGDPSIKKISCYKWNGTTSFDKDIPYDPVEVVEGNQTYLVATAKYGDTEFTVSNLTIVKWYDKERPANDLTAEIELQNSNIKAKEEQGLFGSIGLGVTAGLYETGKTEGTVGVVISDGVSTNNIYADIKIKERSVSRYIIATPDKTIPPAPDHKLTPAWLSNVELTPQDKEVAIGTTKLYKVFTVYDNDQVEEANFANGSFTFESSNAGILPVDSPAAGSAITVTATENGGIDDAKAGQTSEIKVSKDGKFGSAQLKLGKSKVKGLTYYVRDSEKIGKYQKGTVPAAITPEIKKADQVAAGIEIPRGLDAHIWVVPKFTNLDMFGTKTPEQIAKDYGITGGLDKSSATSSNPANPLTGIGMGAGADATANRINTENDIQVDQEDPITLTFTTNGPVTSHGDTYEIASASPLAVSTIVKIVAPIVVAVEPTLYDTASHSYISTNPGTDFSYDSTAGAEKYVIKGNVGEKLQLRLKVRYSDGKTVDSIGGNTNNTYENGVYFAPMDDPENYNFANGPSQPTAAAGFAGGDDTELSVLHGYFMSKTPKSYAPQVNPVSGSPNWTNGKTPEQMQAILSKLTQEIKINAYKDESGTLTSAPNTEIGADWLQKESKIVPGHYGIELKKAGTYTLDFNSPSASVSEGLGITDNANADKRMVIELRVAPPKAEAVYLVAKDDNTKLTYDTATHMYKFDNTPTNPPGDKTFKVYPVILDTTWHALHPDAASLPTADEVTEANVGGVGNNTGINYVTKADWTDFVDLWNETSGGKFATQEKRDSAGFLYWEVKVLDNIPVATPADIGLSLKSPIAQIASPTGIAYTIPAPQPADPTPIKVYTEAEDQVVDIVIVEPQATTPAQVNIGDDVEYDIKYQLQNSGNARVLSSMEFPGQSGYDPSKPNMLRVIPGGSNPAGCTFEKGAGSSLVFKPTNVGAYTFTLETTNSSGAPIPTSPVKREIKFNVVPSQLPTQMLYFGENLPIPGSLAPGCTAAEVGGTTNLDAALLSSGVLKMTTNADGTANVEIRNSSGDLISTLAVTLKKCDLVRSLVPDTVATPDKYADGETRSIQWKLSYKKPIIGDVTMVTYEPIQPAEAQYLAGSADFLTFNVGQATANIPASAPAVPILTGIYKVTNADGTTATYRAQLDRNITPPQTPRIYEFRDGLLPGANVLTNLNFNTLGTTKNVYLFDVTDPSNKFNVTDFNVTSSPTGPVGVVNATGFAKVTSIANGLTNIIFNAVQANSTGTATLQALVAYNTAPPALTITTHPADQTVTEGTTATFTAAATTTVPSATVQYKWQVDEGSGWTDVIGAVSPTLYVNSTTMAMNGNKYRCEVRDGMHTQTTNAATLTVTAAPTGTVNITTQPTDQTVAPGTNATFTIAATTTIPAGTVTYKWQEETAPGVWTDIIGETAPTYVVTSTTLAMTGKKFRCEVTDGTTTVNSNVATLTVSSGTLSFTTQPANVSVAAGAAATFTAAATTTIPAGTVTYKWQEETTPGVWNDIPGATAGTYTIPSVTTAMNAKKFRCEATDGTNTLASTPATLTVTSSGGGGSGGGGGGGSSSGHSSGTVNYVLTFESNGGSSIPNVTKASGTNVDLSSYVPTKDGFNFKGWYKEEGLTNEVSSVVLDKNMTVYAKWEAKPVTMPFTDVSPSDYFADAVKWAVEKGITQGTSDTTFSPNNICTRAHMVTFLWRAMGSPEPTATTTPFKDVSKDAYYYKAVVWATEKGVTKGVSDTMFAPDKTVTRAQTVTFMWRTEGAANSTAANPFKDVSKEAYYAQAVKWAVEKGITKGVSDTMFAPESGCTRAQIVTFIYRYMNK